MITAKIGHQDNKNMICATIRNFTAKLVKLFSVAKNKNNHVGSNAMINVTSVQKTFCNITHPAYECTVSGVA